MKHFAKQKNSVIKISDDFSSIKYAAKYEAINGEGIKISTSKQVLQKLLIELPQLKADNASKNKLNETCQIKYSLLQANEIIAKVDNSTMNSIKL